MAVAVAPIESAKEAGLRYLTDAKPGIRRERSGEGFRYIGPDKSKVTDGATLARIKALAIPPAWTEVWISPISNGHLQATGRDAKGRKQYRYHAKWRETRDETKFSRSLAFAKALPKVRARVEADLAKPGLPREKVLATVVRLLEKTLIRVGNEEYARENKSYGLATMRNKHVKVEGSLIHFTFNGKSGKKHHIDVKDRKLAKIVEKCMDLPGYELFAYLDENGHPCDVRAEDVNGYLKEITGEEYTAKDFRTWAGTVLAALALQEFEEIDTQAARKRNVVQAIEQVSQRLGNTPTICRKCYVNPVILDAYLDGSMIDAMRQRAETELKEDLSELPPEEAAVLTLLHQLLESKLSDTKVPTKRKAS